MLLHGCNVFVVDPKMLVWDENMAQIHDTTRLPWFCGRDVAVVRYEHFTEMNSATFFCWSAKQVRNEKHFSNEFYCAAAMFVWPTISCMCGMSTSRKCILLHGKPLTCILLHACNTTVSNQQLSN